ncbi:MAG: hypothetical protein QXF45_01825 [Candidatus Caldarchaeum sp.]
MSTIAIGVIFLLSVGSLAGGLAMNFGLVGRSELVVLGHSGLGAMIILLNIAVISALRKQRPKVVSDLSFLLFLTILQTFAGILMFAEIELASLVHLVLSFFVVASAASCLIIAASGS